VRPWHHRSVASSASQFRGFAQRRFADAPRGSIRQPSSRAPAARECKLPYGGPVRSLQPGKRMPPHSEATKRQFEDRALTALRLGSSVSGRTRPLPDRLECRAVLGPARTWPGRTEANARHAVAFAPRRHPIRQQTAAIPRYCLIQQTFGCRAILAHGERYSTRIARMFIVTVEL
jgi:hypothetical protein